MPDKNWGSAPRSERWTGEYYRLVGFCDTNPRDVDTHFSGDPTRSWSARLSDPPLRIFWSLSGENHDPIGLPLTGPGNSTVQDLSGIKHHASYWFRSKAHERDWWNAAMLGYVLLNEPSLVYPPYQCSSMRCNAPFVLWKLIITGSSHCDLGKHRPPLHSSATPFGCRPLIPPIRPRARV